MNVRLAQYQNSVFGTSDLYCQLLGAQPVAMALPLLPGTEKQYQQLRALMAEQAENKG